MRTRQWLAAVIAATTLLVSCTADHGPRLQQSHGAQRSGRPQSSAAPRPSDGARQFVARLGGHDAADSRDASSDSTLSALSARHLKLRWKRRLAGDVSATPAVVGGKLYVPDWAGYLNKLDAATGKIIWRIRISQYDGVTKGVSRSSPAVIDGVVYFGDLNGAHLMAVRASDGTLLWRAQLDTHPDAILTQSPLVYRGVVYQGVSSREDTHATDPNYRCCTFRGSVAAVAAASGKLLWKTYTVPDNGGRPGGYSGGSVWGGAPAIDDASGVLYVTTGNNYTVPASATRCQRRRGTPVACLAGDDHIDSMLALDARSGRIIWATGKGGFDAWTVACVVHHGTCPKPTGADADFGSGPNLFKIHKRLVVGAGQKSGIYWVADAHTGRVLWGTRVGPGSNFGGILWGTATDGTRIYVANANGSHTSYRPAGATRTSTAGAWTALDAATGAIIWQRPDPAGGVDEAAVTVANGVVFAASMSGHMYALNASTGQVIWDYLGAQPSHAQPALVGNMVFWGNGYRKRASPGNLYAFGV